MTNITLLNGVGSIEANVFPECANLRNITIPSSVTNIGDTAFSGCTSLANITIPASVTTLGWRAFADCQSLVAVYVLGNAPTCDTNEFIYDSNVTIYYLPGSTGWSNTFAGVPALLWDPVIQTTDGNFGLRNQQFGFNITGTLNIPIAVEVTTNLGSPLWTPLQSLLLTNGLFYFSDSQWTNRAAGYYRLSSP